MAPEGRHGHGEQRDRAPALAGLGFSERQAIRCCAQCLPDAPDARLQTHISPANLPRVLQRDVKSLFGSYATAVADADQLLFSAGNMSRVRAACSECSVGKLTNTALYVHVDALDNIPAVLRIYEGCARTFIGAIASTSMVKLRFDEPVVSYLAYPTFDVDPHPPLAELVVVPLQTFRVSIRDYSNRENPPILHRKELFVRGDYPLRAKFERLTRQEERWGLFDETERIGTRCGWEDRLAQCGVRLAGHRMVRVRGLSAEPQISEWS